MRSYRNIANKLRKKSSPYYHQFRRAIRSNLNHQMIKANNSDRSSAQRVLEWLVSQELVTGGIKSHSESSLAYPEITGYIIPTLIDYDQNEFASRLINWLLLIQQRDGSFTNPHGQPYIFDTGQALRGLLCGFDALPGASIAAERAANYIYCKMKDDGRRGFAATYNEFAWIPESIHLYVLPPFCRYAEMHDKENYSMAAENCQNFYIKHKEALNINKTLTHFLAYELEALIDLGYSELAIPILNSLEDNQDSNGAVAGKPNYKWVCTPGLAQLAICWYKVKNNPPADAALRWVESNQQPSGGFLGSYGWLPSYFPDVELPWAAKFYLDACKLGAHQI